MTTVTTGFDGFLGGAVVGADGSDFCMKASISLLDSSQARCSVAANPAFAVASWNSASFSRRLSAEARPSGVGSAKTAVSGS